MVSAPSSSTAQTASFRAIDQNRDNVLSYDELVAAFGRAGADRLLQAEDKNGDRRLTIPELRQGAATTNDDDGDRPTARSSNDRSSRDNDSRSSGNANRNQGNGGSNRATAPKRDSGSSGRSGRDRDDDDDDDDRDDRDDDDDKDDD